VLSLALIASAGAFAADDGQVALDVSLRARAIAPGEPMRVVVDAPVPLASASAELLGREVFLVPEAASAAAGERWTGWTLVELDQEPGEAVVHASGFATDGRAASGVLALRVEPREFPVERLSVAREYVEPPREVRERLESEREVLGRVYETRTPFVSSPAAFVRPVAGEPTSVFGTRRLFNGEPRAPHPGIDLRAAEGTPVVSAGPGTVLLARDLYYSGGTVIVDHGAGLFTIYAHLSRIHADEGKEIRAGEVIGFSGSTGRVTGPHLHWGGKVGDRPFDPRALLDEALFD
jgi:murein DD-endopeptidase MepM/ murein hydrolase activator NlpD